MKIKERIAWISLTSLLFICLVIPRNYVSAISEESTEYLKIFHEVLTLVQSDYIDDFSESKLYIGAIRGLLSVLNDPHTRFLDKQEYNELREDTRGKFGGLGLEVSYVNNEIIVVSPMDGTPAMRAGILPQDKIVKIDNVDTSSLTLTECVNLMKGKPGTSVNLHIKRPNIDDPFQVSLIRELIKIRFVNSTIIQDKNIAYVKLSQFMGKDSTLDDFVNALNDTIQTNTIGLIIDLRNNPGGLLTLAVELVDLFVPSDLEIVSVKGRGGKLIKSYKSTTTKNKWLDIPIVVLINEGSASASEIFSGAIQDLKRGTIIGTKSFGKGSVQNIYSLSSNTGVALTIQKYFTPSGQSIHGIGIQPDKLVEPIKPTEEEQKYLIRIYQDNLVENFTKSHSNYSDDLCTEFQKLLNSKDIKVRDEIIKFILKSKYFIDKKKPLIDLDFDIQLKEAINALTTQI